MGSAKCRSALLLAALCILSLWSAGCKKTESPPPERAPAGSAPARTLVIGLIPEQNIFRQIERYEPLARYLSRKTGVKVQLHVFPRYGNIIDSFTATGMDGAFFGSFTYCLAHRRLGVEVLARPENADGRSTYHGMILVRKDSGIRSAEDMRGRRFAFVDKATAAGYLLPLVYFREQRIDYRKFFKETYFAGTHEDVIHDILNRKADAGAVKNTIVARLAASDARIASDLVMLASSPEFPENAFAVRKGLDASLKEALRDALLSMHADREGKTVLQAFGARRFLKTDDADYRTVYDYARSAGLDVATYDYLSD